MNRFKEQRKREQLEATEKQSRSLPPTGYHHDEDYLSGMFVDQQPTNSIGSKRAVKPPPSRATSKKARAANAEEKLQEGMNTPLPQVMTVLETCRFSTPSRPPHPFSCLLHTPQMP
jgi:hypothetical protein